VFIALGASATGLGRLLLQYRYEANLVGGAIVIVFGLLMMGLTRWAPWALRDVRLHPRVVSGHPGAAFVLGLAFGFGWASCIGPILGAILTLSAVQTSVQSGISYLSAYAVGLGVPFVLSPHRREVPGGGAARGRLERKRGVLAQRRRIATIVPRQPTVPAVRPRSVGAASSKVGPATIPVSKRASATTYARPRGILFYRATRCEDSDSTVTLREREPRGRLASEARMSKPDSDTDDGDPWADIRKRLDDIGRRPQKGRWAVVKDRLAIVGVILVLAFLVFMMIDGSIENFRCSFVQFITFQCNRWDAAPKPWN
jgi:hypothetical protein